MPTYYEPFDGDYDGRRIDDLIRFAGDLLGDFAVHRELCLSMEDDNTIRVLASNDCGDEWIFDHCYDVPDGWTVEQAKDLFQHGNIYFQPDVDVECLDDTEDEE